MKVEHKLTLRPGNQIEKNNKTVFKWEGQGEEARYELCLDGIRRNRIIHNFLIILVHEHVNFLLIQQLIGIVIRFVVFSWVS